MRLFFMIFFAFAIIDVTCVNLTAANTQLSRQQKIELNMNNSSKLKISIDPRIELLSVIELLSGYGERLNLVNPNKNYYKQEVLKYFEPVKNHPVLEVFNKMSENFNMDAPVQAMLFLSAPPELNIEHKFTDYIIKRAGGTESLMNFINLLRDFSQKSNFLKFFENHQATYKNLVEEIEKEVKKSDYVKMLSDYSGDDSGSYSIIMAPLLCFANFGASIINDNGEIDRFMILTSTPSKEDNLEFKYPALFYMIWHEFGHSFVNPLTKKNIDKFQSSISIFNDWNKTKKSQPYDNYETMLNEYILRALVIRIAKSKYGSDYAKMMMDYEKQWGFEHIATFCKIFETYEQNRNEYKSLDDFYPVLAQKLSELVKTNANE